MQLVFSELAWEQYLYWQANDRRLIKKINILIKDTQRSPNDGLGHPEPLKHELAGYWSRRIDEEHRLVYRIVETDGEPVLEIIQCRHHY